MKWKDFCKKYGLHGSGSPDAYLKGVLQAEEASTDDKEGAKKIIHILELLRCDDLELRVSGEK
jgi:hypothetical protein